LQLQAQFAKPTDLVFLGKKKEEIANSIATVKAKDFKAPPNHLQTLVDALGIFGVVFMIPGDDMKDYLKEMYEGIYFNGNKVLKLDKDLDTKWFNALSAVCEAHYKFTIKNIDSVTKWTGSSNVGVEASFSSQ